MATLVIIGILLLTSALLFQRWIKTFEPDETGVLPERCNVWRIAPVTNSLPVLLSPVALVYAMTAESALLRELAPLGVLLLILFCFESYRRQMRSRPGRLPVLTLMPEHLAADGLIMVPWTSILAVEQHTHTLRHGRGRSMQHFLILVLAPEAIVPPSTLDHLATNGIGRLTQVQQNIQDQYGMRGRGVYIASLNRLNMRPEKVLALVRSYWAKARPTSSANASGIQ